MNLYITRHAQSVHNEWFIKRLYTPSLWFSPAPHIVDAKLSKKGLSQAKSLSKKVETLSIDLVIVSPLTRAIQTMQISMPSHHHVPVIVTPLIRERCDRLADTGLSLSELKKTHPNYSFLHFESDHWWVYDEPNNLFKENNNMVLQRAEKFKAFLKTRTEKNVYVVSHGNFIRLMLGQWRMNFNCEISHTRLEDLVFK